MVIKVFNQTYGGWYDTEIDDMQDLIDLLDDEKNRLPEKKEIDKKHRDHMFTYEEIESRLLGMNIFSVKGLYN